MTELVQNPETLPERCTELLYVKDGVKIYRHESGQKISGTPLTRDQNLMVAAIEQYWTMNGCFPEHALLEREFKLVSGSLLQVLSHPTVEIALENRGIDPAKTNAFLSPEQVAAVQLVLGSVGDRRSLGTKLRTLGLTEAKWRGWLKQKKFKTYLQQQSELHFQDFLPEARIALTQAVAKGDVNAIKFYYEVTGEYRRDDSLPDVRVMMIRVLEAVQKHVSPEQLAAISGEFDAILEGRVNNVRAIKGSTV